MLSELAVFVVTDLTDRLMLTVGNSAHVIVPIGNVITALGSTIIYALHIVQIEVLGYSNVVFAVILISASRAFALRLTRCLTAVVEHISFPLFIRSGTTGNDTRMPMSIFFKTPNGIAVLMLMYSGDRSIVVH